MKDDFTCCYFDQDHLGNVRQVIEADGTAKGKIIQKMDYYPFGAEFCDIGAKNYDQKRKYNGKEFDNMHGLNTYDYGARQYNPVTARWDRMDPLAEKYSGISPYVYCVGNPVMFIDPDGSDTLNVTLNNDGKWIFDNPIIAKGNDVFNVTANGETSTYTFSEGEYGERVCALNLDNNDKYTLGVYHVSGASDGGTGFFTTPGGSPSIKQGSGKRIPEGNYPILKPNERGEKWRQPQVGGNVSDRGIRFHYGSGDVVGNGYTKGCFVLSTDYSINNGRITIDLINSKNAVQNFDYSLGGGPFYPYKDPTKPRSTKFGSHFDRPIKHKLYLQSR